MQRIGEIEFLVERLERLERRQDRVAILERDVFDARQHTTRKMSVEGNSWDPHWTTR